MAVAANNTEVAEPSKRRVWLDVVLVFLVIVVDGAWPVPDVNEAHYLTKAKHYWDRDWLARDLFLSSSDSHVVFFATFGGLTQVLPLPAAAWVGRILGWACLAWGWQRLSYVLIPRFGWAALTAAASIALAERGHLAGEWVVGGCEAKVIAYAFVFAGYADVLAGRWNRGLAWLGAATAFHVLVGGWSLATAGFVWLLSGSRRPPIREWLPGLVIAVLLALPGLLPALALARNADEATVAAANQIYVYQRLAHHLDPQFIVPRFGLRHFVLWGVWLTVCLLAPADGARRTLRQWTLGAGLIAVVGLVIGYALPYQSPRAASLLRFYWFRTSDVMVAVGLAFEFAGLSTVLRPEWRRLTIGTIALIAAGHLTQVVVDRARLPFARSENLGYADNLPAWRDVCDWIRANTPTDALFLTPRPFATFKWYAERAEYAVWKDVPQDAASLVEWRRRLDALYDFQTVWLNYVPEEKIRHVAEQDRVDYLVTYREPRLAFPEVYSNNDFVVYRLAPPPQERP